MSDDGQRTEHLADQIAPAAQTQLFRHDAQGAVGGDEVDGLYARVMIESQQQMARK